MFMPLHNFELNDFSLSKMKSMMWRFVQLQLASLSSPKKHALGRVQKEIIW